MSYAWEVTEDDILFVMEQRKEAVKYGSNLFKKLSEFFQFEHSGRVEKAALAGDDMMEQTDYAYAEMHTILDEDDSWKE